VLYLLSYVGTTDLDENWSVKQRLITPSTCAT
jgi:hypothetical protein